MPPGREGSQRIHAPAPDVLVANLRKTICAISDGTLRKRKKAKKPHPSAPYLAFVLCWHILVFYPHYRHDVSLLNIGLPREVSMSRKRIPTALRWIFFVVGAGALIASGIYSKAYVAGGTFLGQGLRALMFFLLGSSPPSCTGRTGRSTPRILTDRSN